MNHNCINEDFINQACYQIWQVRQAIASLGMLLEVDKAELKDKAIANVGTGQMLKILSKTLEATEDFLQSSGFQSLNSN